MSFLLPERFNARDSWLPSDLERSSVGGIRELLFEGRPEVGRNMTRENRTAIYDDEVDVAIPDDLQDALRPASWFIVIVEEKAGGIAKPVKVIHLRTVGCGEDIFATGVLSDNCVQGFIGPCLNRGCSNAAEAANISCDRSGVRFVRLPHRVEKSGSDLEHYIEQHEAIGSDQEEPRLIIQQRDYSRTSQNE